MSGKHRDINSALELFRQAKTWVEQSADKVEEIEYLRKLRPEHISKELFFREYVHVVVASGFNVSVAYKIEQNLEGPLKGYDVKAIAVDDEEVRRAQCLQTRGQGEGHCRHGLISGISRP